MAAVRSQVRLPSAFFTPVVSKVAACATLKVACRPACNGTSSRVTVPSWFGTQPGGSPPVPEEEDEEPDEDEEDDELLPPVPPPPVVVVVTGSQVPSALQTPEAQSAPTRQAGSLV